MKKIITAILALALCAGMAVPALAAYDYSFESGGSTLPGFGKPTSTDSPAATDPATVNTRRNKDAAVFPPPYGIFSGEIPTDATSPYHENESGSYYSGTGSAFAGDLMAAGTSADAYSGAAGSSNVSQSETDTVLPSTSYYTPETLYTEPRYYADGSIGSLYIPKLNKTIAVYEGETLENMQKGIGHFTTTSAWDGNVGFAGHNRGAAAYFAFVKDLAAGDRITYTTPYGTRTYEIYRKDQISETDYTSLGWSAENVLTLITCVADAPELRYCVRAREIL
jgi:sortase A